MASLDLQDKPCSLSLASPPASSWSRVPDEARLLPPGGRLFLLPGFRFFSSGLHLDVSGLSHGPVVPLNPSTREYPHPSPAPRPILVFPGAHFSQVPPAYPSSTSRPTPLSFLAAALLFISLHLPSSSSPRNRSPAPFSLPELLAFATLPSTLHYRVLLPALACSLHFSPPPRPPKSSFLLTVGTDGAAAPGAAAQQQQADQQPEAPGAPGTPGPPRAPHPSRLAPCARSLPSQSLRDAGGSRPRSLGGACRSPPTSEAGSACPSRGDLANCGRAVTTSPPPALRPICVTLT